MDISWSSVLSIHSWRILYWTNWKMTSFSFSRNLLVFLSYFSKPDFPIFQGNSYYIWCTHSYPRANGSVLILDLQEVDGVRRVREFWGVMLMKFKEKGIGEDEESFRLQRSSDICEGEVKEAGLGRSSQTTAQFWEDFSQANGESLRQSYTLQETQVRWEWLWRSATDGLEGEDRPWGEQRVHEVREQQLHLSVNYVLCRGSEWCVFTTMTATGKELRSAPLVFLSLPW